MGKKTKTGNEIRQSYIDFFIDKKHKFVRSSSLVPGGDATLLFTNAGMVQFKDIFLGTDQRDYQRATNSQKCMRVAGKHNDLEDVGQDDTHHTFFEMMGNWSFGDYYKKEAITYAWELLTEVWELPKERIYATVFKDELGQIPTDDEAVKYWKEQPGFSMDRLFYLGRKENFWEMGDTGPCGPCSEIHYDLRPEEGPVTDKAVLDTDRFTEIWNLVFIQYNRKGPDVLDPLPNKHVDTGLGLDRVVAILQNVNSNYRTDLLLPLVEAVQELTGDSDQERDKNLTPYRVIADHARAAAFLIADGVVPGNMGRNYICRMIIRRAYRFGGHVGLHSPFLGQIATLAVDLYQDAYPELKQNRKIILNTIAREEEQFQQTLENATLHLEDLLNELKAGETLAGEVAANLYTTFGMPLEITKDIAKERGLSVDEDGFQKAMELHRLNSGAGHAMGDLGGEEVELYRELLNDLQNNDKLDSGGVEYNPYDELTAQGSILAMIKDDKKVTSSKEKDQIQVVLPKTPFYMESGGQVSDTGTIEGNDWSIAVHDIYQPAAGMIVHKGVVLRGNPKVGDQAAAIVNRKRRGDIIRNHTATHLLHAALDKIVGEHARQAGSLVAPDHLRFDFTHNQALTDEQVLAVEEEVNHRILEDHPLQITQKPLQEAIDEGARALFGEKYGDVVRTIKMGDFSYELCGGTHCSRSSQVGLFLITSEGSTAAGIRRIEAVTGSEAYKLVQSRFRVLKLAAKSLSTSPDQLASQVSAVLDLQKKAEKSREKLTHKLAIIELNTALENLEKVGGVNLLTKILEESDLDTLRLVADRFRQHVPEQGIIVLGTVIDGSPRIIASVTEDLIKEGIKAGDLIKYVAQQVGGGGGGRPNLAEAGGKDPEKLPEALNRVADWIKEKTGR
ncbi:MAG: alanine--tRNA ligase [Chloroflexota bacterium]|nr:MAG: alanine--tRNA ligase [Chloroflexota bacterium]